MTKAKKIKISVRGGFSESIGIKTCNTTIQFNDFDERTRVILCNALFDFITNIFEGDYNRYHSFNHKNANDFCKAILSEVFMQETLLDEGRVFNWRYIFDITIKQVILQNEYNEVLDVLSYIHNWLGKYYNSAESYLTKTINEMFEQEYVGYRFVDGKIVAITDQQEIKSIEDACQCEFDGCRTHIKKAVEFLADREHKDYKNCIKESISAIESICSIMVGQENATLGQALKKLEEKGLKIHRAFKEQFLKLYGYASDEGGIRHGEGYFESNVTFEESKYMLVCCSAFVNYLIAEYGKYEKNER